MKKVFIVVCFFIVVSIIFPILISTIYSFPAFDDFAEAAGWNLKTSSGIVYLFTNVKDNYINWQGTYFGKFLAAIPVYNLVGLTGLRVTMFLITVLFFAAIFFVGYAVFKWCQNDKEITTRQIVSVLFTISIPFLLFTMGFNRLSEIFCWYEGAAIYTIPLEIGFIGVALAFLYECDNKKWMIWIASICVFLGAGGALVISSLLTAILMFLLIYNYLVEYKITKVTIVFFSSFIGSVINAIAPGNFARHSVIDTAVRPLTCLWMTINRVHFAISYYFQNGFLILLLVISYAYGVNALRNSRREFKYPVLVTLYGYVTMILVIFPYVLGYSSRTIQERCGFIEQLALAMCVSFIGMYWGAWAAKTKDFKLESSAYIALALICSLLLVKYVDFENLSSLTPYRILWHMNDGDYAFEAARQQSILEQLDNAEQGSDLVIKIPGDYREELWTNIMTVGITDDPEFWINNSVAESYGLNSVILTYGD